MCLHQQLDVRGVPDAAQLARPGYLLSTLQIPDRFQMSFHLMPSGTLSDIY